MAKFGASSLLSEQELLNRITDSTTLAIGTSEVYQPAYEDNTVGVAKVEQRYSYANITASGCPAGNILSTAKFLHNITVNQPVSGVTTVLTDSTAAGGTLIGTIKIPLASTNFNPYTLTYDVALTNGLAASQVSPVATGNDLTISYR